MNLFEIKDGPKKAFDFVQSKFDQRIELLHSYYQECLLNIHYYRGRQYVLFENSRKGRIYDYTKQKETNKVRIVSNKIFPIIRKLIAKYSFTDPMWYMIPATPDEEDIQIAKLQDKILQHMWLTANVSPVILEALSWMLTCASTYLKVDWDKDLGQYTENKTNLLDEQVINEFIQAQGITKKELGPIIKTKNGDICIKNIPIFNILYDLSCKTIDKSLWTIESQIYPLDYIVNKYGNKYKKLPVEKYHNLLLRTDDLEEDSIYNQEGVLWHELHVVPCNLVKKGFHGTYAGGMIIDEEDCPYDHKQQPYAQMREVDDLFTSHGTSTVEQIRPQQITYNRTRSVILENANYMGNLQYLVPRSASVGEITTRPGGFIHYNHPYKPEVIQPRGLPSYIFEQLGLDKADIQDTASTHDVTEGKVEPGVRSGKLALVLQEADDTVLAPVVRSIDEAIARIGRLALQTKSQYLTDEETINIVGQYNERELVTYRGEQLKGKNFNNDYFNVRIKAAGRRPMSRLAREQQVDNLLERGVLNPQQHFYMILHMLGVSDIAPITDELEAARSKQYREIRKIVEKQEELVKLLQSEAGKRALEAPLQILSQLNIFVDPADNHDIHLEVINKYVSSPEYDKLSPLIRVLIATHREEHIRAKAAEMAKVQVYAQIEAQKLLGVTNAGTNGTTEGRTT